MHKYRIYIVDSKGYDVVDCQIEDRISAAEANKAVIKGKEIKIQTKQGIPSEY